MINPRINISAPTPISPSAHVLCVDVISNFSLISIVVLFIANET
jgi:hypothetical protein